MKWHTGSGSDCSCQNRELTSGLANC